MTAGERHQAETHQAIEATFRIERARLIADLARIVRNVDSAEDLLISRGLDALARAAALGPKVEDAGPYVLQAALAACHAGARRAADTDWPRIAALYDRLRVVAPSPVVDLNRAIAHSMAFGPEAGLRLVDEIADAAALRDYAPLPAARGDFLFRAGRLAEARSEFKAAATLTRNARERAFLLARADACDCKH